MIHKKKTWQREVAVVLLCFLMYLAYESKVEELQILVWPFTVFAFGAFGFKQEPIQSYMGKGGSVFTSGKTKETVNHNYGDRYGPEGNF